MHTDTHTLVLYSLVVWCLQDPFLRTFSSSQTNTNTQKNTGSLPSQLSSLAE
uniref:Uncharacterized protein n=1 Tax=Anguilla anguilla TaxID=7936 RepID=A0A0E9VCG9_ANGAN